MEHISAPENTILLTGLTFDRKTHQDKMAASRLMLQSTTISLFLFFVACFVPNIQSQSIGNPPAVPTVRDCSSVLVPLAPCGPFAQGTEPSPAQLCCNNLRQLNSQQLSCLCLMLNDPSLSSFPINKTLAFELPILCSIPRAMSTCSGMSAPLPPSTPASQVSFGARSNATAAASPVVTVKPNFNGTGRDPHISGAKLNAVNHLVVALLAETIFVGTTYTYESWSIMFLNV